MDQPIIAITSNSLREDMAPGSLVVTSTVQTDFPRPRLPTAMPAPPTPPSAPVAELPNAGPLRPLVCFAPLPAFLYLPSSPVVLIFI